MIRRMLHWLHARLSWTCDAGIYDDCPCGEDAAADGYREGYREGLDDGFQQARDSVDQWHRPLSY